MASSSDGLAPWPFDPALLDPGHPSHAQYMNMALQEAAEAANINEVPVGCVVVSMSRGVIARAHNERERLRDPTAHAEMIAITMAAQAMASWRLEGCMIYITLEPCAMCAGAIVLARIPGVIYGAADPKAGACRSLYSITEDSRLNHRCRVIGGVMAETCGGILSTFFAARRGQLER